MNTTYYFHICRNEDRFSGSGKTCYDAAINAIGIERAKRLMRNTRQLPYNSKGRLVGVRESGVSNIVSKNGTIVASVTRLVN